MRVLFYFLTISVYFMLPVSLTSQMASNHNGLADYYPPTFTKPFIEKHDPISEWPQCTEPKDIIVTDEKDDYVITWDGTEKIASKYYYEVQINDGSRSDDMFALYKNAVRLSKSNFGRSGKDEIKLRRVCYAGGDKKLYSEWVSQVLASPPSNNNCNIQNGGILTGPNSQNCVCNNHNFVIVGSDPPSSCTTHSFQWFKKNGCKTNASFDSIPGATDRDLNISIQQETMFKRVMNCPNCTPQQYESYICMYIPTLNLSGNECAQTRKLVFNYICNQASNSYNWSNGATTSEITVPRTSAGTYTCSVTLGTGCTDVLQKTVSFQPFFYIDTPMTLSPCMSNNTFTISGTFYTDINYTGTVTIKYNNNEVFKLNSTFTANTPYSFTTSNLIANGTQNNILKVQQSCGSTNYVIAAPAPCSTSSPCSITNPSISPPTNCTNNTFDLPFSCTVTNSVAGQSLQASFGGLSTIVAIDSNGIATGIIPNIPYGTPLGNVTFNTVYVAPYCSAQVVFSPPSASTCNPTACSINFTNGACDGNTYTVNGSVNIAGPIAGSELTVTDYPSGTTRTINVLAGVHTYSFTITGLYADGAEHTITLGGVSCADAVPSVDYTAPSGCSDGIACGIVSMTATPGACNASDNKYSVSGTVIINCAMADVLSIKVQGYPDIEIVIPTSADNHSYPFTINDLNSNGQATLIYAVTQLSGAREVTISAPQICASSPSMKCGDPYAIPPPTNDPVLDKANPGDIFLAAGLPVIVTTVSGGNGTFTGTGLLVTPFNAKKLKVTFNGITINKNYKITAGDVVGVSSLLNLDEMIQVDTFSLGGDICIVEPAPEEVDLEGFNKDTGLNARGFGRDSLYSDGTRYDPDGYDYNGIHKDTGTAYNESGCDMNGLDIDKQPCVTDTTLRSIVTIIFNDVVPTITTSVTGSLLTSLTDSLSTFNCDAIRTAMNSKIGALAYDAKYIKGRSNEYFDKGMHKNFESEPKPLLNNSGRLPDAVELEKKHIELYQCDLLSIQIEEMIKNLQNVNPEKLAAFILSELKKLDAAKLQELKDSADARLNWVKEQVLEFLKANGSGPGIGSAIQKQNIIDIAPKEANRLLNAKRSFSSEFFSLVASDDTNYYYDPAPGEEESWLYNQGFKSIKGIDRAFYLEEAYKQMQQEMLLLGGNADEGIMQPILLNKDSAGVSYNIYLDNIKVSPTGASLDAYFVFKVPQAHNKKLVMKALNLNWGAGGMIGETKLQLGSAIEIRVSNAAILRLNPGIPGQPGGTYVSWDCKGFKSIGIDADVEVCRDFIVPLGPNLQPLAEPARFSAKIIVEISHWSDLYFEVSADKAFAIKGYEQYKWQLKGLVVDMSDYRSPAPDPMFPGFVTKNYSNGSFDGSWRGFYLKELTVTFPNGFAKDSTKQISVGVNNLVIDDMGASGIVNVTNIVSLDDGSLGGWPFSIDTAKIIVLHNHIVGGGLGGRLKVPVFKDAMRYGATIYSGNKYEFKISPTTSQEMDMLLATVTLDSSSSVRVVYDDGNVIAEAKLTGDIEVGKLGNSKNGLALPSAHFVDLTVRNVAPYFNSGKWSITGGIKGKLAGFELGIDSIRAFSRSDVETGLSFKIGVTFPCNLSAFGGLEVLGMLSQDEKGRQLWVHNDTKLNSFGIDASFSAGHVKGYLETFEGLASYGTGFQGLVNMKFNAIGELKAMALFGNAGFKYFFIDAEATLSTGIPAGPLEINGFVGGVSYKMNVEASGSPYSGSGLPAVGSSFSGNNYIPDDDKGLGFRAGVKIRMAKNPKIFNGQVVFEMLFNAVNVDGSGGGISRVALDGKGQLMADLPVTGILKEGDGESKPNGVSASLSAHIRFQYNHDARVFTGAIKAYLNAGILTGVGAGGKMVDANIYAGPGKWYFHFGTPTNPCGLKLGDFATLKTYLCIGTEIPGLPAVPADVQAVAGNIKPNAALMNNGSGFLFGANFEAKSKLNFWVGSAEMKTKAGFDIMVRDFGEGASCAGRSGGLGINGWYGVGQLWALIEGKLEIAGFTILDAGLAGILQAQMPNPFYAQASLGVKVKIFGIKVNKNIDVNLGDECTIVRADDDSSLGMKVISQVSPGNGGKKMPVDVVPQVYLNLPLSTVYELTPDKFVVKKSSISLKSLKTGQVYNFTTHVSNDSTLIELVPANVFNANDSIEIVAKMDIFKNNQLFESEIETSVFTTDKGYTNIPLANIESSYPIDGMNNYYKNEFNQSKGFIQLKSGMPELFYNIPEGFTQKLRLTKFGGESTVFDYNQYDGLNARLEFPLDPAMLDNEANYTLELVRIPNGSSPSTTPSVGVDPSIRSNDLNYSNILGINEGNGNAEGSETVLVALKFRVSKFNTFVDKINSGIVNATTKEILINQEKFDEKELKNLIDFNLNKNHTWFGDIYNIVYLNINLSGFGCESIQLFNPDEHFNGLSDEIGIFDNGNSTVIKNKIVTKVEALREELIYLGLGCPDFINSMYQTEFHADYNNLKNTPVPNPSPPLDIKISYTIPGIGTTSHKSLNL